MSCSTNGLHGKVVIVTGSSSGIGRATAIEFAKQHCRVVLTARNEEALKESVKLCIETGAKSDDVVYIVGDVTKDSERQAIVDKAVTLFGGIDVLVNNAGYGKWIPIENTSLELFDETFDINVKSVVRLTQFAMPHLKKSQGNVVNVSSVASVITYTNAPIYAMSKAALDSFTKLLATELSPHKVRVNAVLPGTIDTDIFLKAGQSPEGKEEYFKECAAGNLLGRVGRSDEVADLITFLASDKASFITGVIVPIDAGLATTNSYYSKPHKQA